MTATTLSSTAAGSYAARRERRKIIGYGIFFLLMALAIYLFFVRNSAADMISTFVLNPTTKEKVIKLSNWVLPTRSTLLFLAVVTTALGLYQVARGFKRVVPVLDLVSLLFVFAFWFGPCAANPSTCWAFSSSPCRQQLPLPLAL